MKGMNSGELENVPLAVGALGNAEVGTYVLNTYMFGMLNDGW